MFSKGKCLQVTLIGFLISHTVICHTDRVAYKIQEGFSIYSEDFKLSQQAVHTSLVMESVHDCQAACEQSKDFHCEAVAYCSKVAMCFLTSYLVTSRNITVREEGCVILTRNYTSVYDAHKFIFLSVESVHEESDVTDKETCAQRCLAAVWCKGFEFCENRKHPVCTLHMKHFRDLPKDAVQKNFFNNESCSFYDRNYILEFRQQPGKILSGIHYRILGQLSEAQCAEVCANYSYNSCLAFDYCGGSNISESLCMLSKDDEFTNSHVTFINHPICDHYSRKFEPWKIQPLDHVFSARRRYSAGAVAGVGLGFLVVGLILGFLASLGYSKWQCKFRPAGEGTERYQAGFRFMKFENKDGASNSMEDTVR